MDASLKASMIGMIPFRALLTIARALGGVGQDPHRIPGGKNGLADALISRYGADAILTAWQSQTKMEAPESTETTPSDVPETPEQPKDEPSFGGAVPGDRDAKGEGDAEGEAGMGESESKAEGGEAEATKGPQGEAEGQGEPKTPAEGEEAPTGPEKGESGDSEGEGPDACPQGDEPAPAPREESMMDKAMRAIAAEEAARAVYPVANWANTQMIPAHNALAARAPASSGPVPLPDSSDGKAPPAPLPRPGMPKGASMQHKLFPKLLALARAGVYPLMVGPAGTGKSHAARAAAAAMGRSYADQSLSAGVSESALTGWLLPVKEGMTCAYVPSPFVTAYETGNAVFLFDEIDAASPDMLVILNGALANGGFTVPQRFDRPYVTRGDALALMGAANTINGADDSYGARMAMDAATKNRFYPLHWAHDDALEAHMLGLPTRQRYWKPEGRIDWSADPEAWAKASTTAKAWVGAVRKTIDRTGLAHVFSMRQAVMYQKALSVGCTHREIREDLLLGWGPDEIAKLPADAQPKNAPVVGAEVEAV